jgi:hypothetical protein
MTNKKPNPLINYPLTSIVMDWLKEQDFDDEIDINHELKTALVKISVQVNRSKYQLVIEVSEPENLISIYLYAEKSVVFSKLAQSIEWINGINSNITLGRLFSIENYPIQFKQSIDIECGELSTKMISNVFEFSIQLFENNKDQIELFSIDELSINPLDLSEAYEWSNIDGHLKIKKWAENLKKSINLKYDENGWSLVGKGAIIINDNPRYVINVLKTVAKYSGFGLIVINNENILGLPEIEIIQDFSPVIVYLEPGRWKRDKSDNDNESEQQTEKYLNLQSKLKSNFEKFSVKKPVIFVTSTSDINQYVSNEIKQPGMFDLYMSLPRKSYDLIGQDFIGKLGESICSDNLISSLGKIGHLINSYDFQKEALTILALKRRNYDEKRKLEYLDLVDTDIHDLIEEGLIQEKNDHVRLNTAYHEAGHALISIFESGGLNVPEYTSILPGASGFAGITVASKSYLLQMSSELTFEDYRKEIRICLAGRIAEEIFNGPEKVSDGARSDLEKATRCCLNMFKDFGFSPLMEEEGGSSLNLAIIFGEVTSQENEYLMEMTRSFLSKQHTIVKKKLLDNKILLDDLANLLMSDPIVDQKELSQLCNKHNIYVTTEN